MNDDEEVLVSGLPLPSALVAVIRAGRWLPPLESGLLATLFRDRPAQPTFYGIDGIIGETAHWHSESDRETLEWYVGVSNDADPPGDIDQQRSVVIGDLGPDQPFALDYRHDISRPRVVYLTTYNGWIEVAPDIESLLDRLGLKA